MSPTGTSPSTEPKRLKLDLAASNRMIFGSLGSRVPKDEADKKRVRNKLASPGSKAAAKQRDYVKPAMVEASRLGEDHRPPASEQRGSKPSLDPPRDLEDATQHPGPSFSYRRPESHRDEPSRHRSHSPPRSSGRRSPSRPRRRSRSPTSRGPAPQPNPRSPGRHRSPQRRDRRPPHVLGPSDATNTSNRPTAPKVHPLGTSNAALLTRNVALVRQCTHLTAKHEILKGKHDNWGEDYRKLERECSKIAYDNWRLKRANAELRDSVESVDNYNEWLECEKEDCLSDNARLANKIEDLKTMIARSENPFVVLAGSGPRPRRGTKGTGISPKTVSFARTGKDDEVEKGGTYTILRERGDIYQQLCRRFATDVADAEEHISAQFSKMSQKRARMAQEENNVG